MNVFCMSQAILQKTTFLFALQKSRVMNYPKFKKIKASVYSLKHNEDIDEEVEKREAKLLR